MPTYNQRDKTRSAMTPPPQGDNYQTILQLQAAIRRLETDLETANRKLAETTSLANQHKRQLRGMNFVDSPTIHWDQSAGAIRAHGSAKAKAKQSAPAKTATVYNGPHALSLDTDPRFVKRNAGRIIAGTTVITPTVFYVSFSGTGTFYIYMMVYVVYGNYVAEMLSYSTEQVPTTNYYFHLIGMVEVEDDLPVSDPVQCHFGDIHIAGRYTY